MWPVLAWWGIWDLRQAGCQLSWGSPHGRVCETGTRTVKGQQYAMEIFEIRWPTSTLLLWYAHCCSVKLFFFSSEHFAALQSTFRLCRAVFLPCQAFFSYSERFFGSAKQFSAMLNPFLLCQPFFSVLSTSLLCQAYFGYAKHFPSLPFFSYSERFSALLSIFSFMMNIFLPHQAFFSYAEHFVCSAKHV